MSVHAANERTYDKSGRWRTRTYANVAEASGVDNTVYVKGDAFTDGSIRLAVADGITNVERRDDGVWNLSEVEISGSTLHLGHGLEVSGIVDGLLVHSLEDGEEYLLPEIPFDKLLGTSPARTHVAGAANIRLVIQPFDLVDVVLPVFGNVFEIGRTHQSYVYNLYVKVGAVPPDDPVTLRIETGKILGAGTVFLEHVFPTSFFPANTEVKIPFGQGIGFFPETNFVLQLSSPTPFALRGHPLGFAWAAIDEQDFLYEDLVSFYTGTDKIVTDPVSGNIVIDKGNIVADVEKQGFNFS